MQTRETESDPRKREENLSKDGKWRSFPKVPHLLQYVSNGNYYGRIKMGGKLIRESLQTTVWTTAKLRLTDFLKTNQETRHRIDPPQFSEAVELFKIEIDRDTTIKRRSKEYRHRCLNKIHWHPIAAKSSCNSSVFRGNSKRLGKSALRISGHFQRPHWLNDSGSVGCPTALYKSWEKGLFRPAQIAKAASGCTIECQQVQ